MAPPLTTWVCRNSLVIRSWDLWRRMLAAVHTLIHSWHCKLSQCVLLFYSSKLLSGLIASHPHFFFRVTRWCDSASRGLSITNVRRWTTTMLLEEPNNRALSAWNVPSECFLALSFQEGAMFCPLRRSARRFNNNLIHNNEDVCFNYNKVRIFIITDK